MKKSRSMKLFSAILCGAILLSAAGCGSSSSPASSAPAPASSAAAISTPAAEKPQGEAVSLLYSTHSVGTATYNIAAGLGQLWENYLPEGSMVDVQPTSPGGMGAPYLFADGLADIAFGNGAPAKWAYEEGVLGKPATQEFRGLIGSLTAVGAVNFMTQAFLDKYSVTTFEEVIEKKLPIRIGCSPKGSMDEKILEMLLEYLGVTYDDVKSWGGDIVHGGGSDLAAMVKDGKLDMVLDQTSAQSSTMTEIAMTAKIKFTQWTDETLDWFTTQGFERVVLPANSFSGQTEDIILAGSPDCIYVAKDMPDDVAYALSKGMCENRDELVRQYSSLAPFDPPSCWKPEKLGNVPLHSGAEKYFKEMGYIK